MSSDEQQMEAYKQGSEAAFSHLYEKYSPLVYGYARKRLRSGDIDDFYQKVWGHLHEKRELYAGQPFAPWFFVLIRNLLYDEYRSRARQKNLEGQITPATATEENDLEEILEQVSPDAADLIRKYYVEGYDYADLEKVTGLSQTGLRKRLSRAIHVLRDKFEGKA
jgi:RNA polymerase sigma-70 factor, ECF subfamily